MKFTKKMQRALAMILCIVSLLSLAACGQNKGGNPANSSEEQSSATNNTSDKKDTSEKKEVEQKKVVIVMNAIFNTLNPFATNANSDQAVFNQVYETLAILGDDSAPIPCLAESWEISEDGMDYTIHLVKDAVFHNGEKLTAKDVAFTYEFAQQFPSRKLYYSMVESTEIIDDHTLIFHLTAPSPLFLTYSQSVPILNEKWVTENGVEGLEKEVCGTGPYTIKSYDPASSVELVAFKDYRLGEAAIKEAELRLYSDKSSAQIALETGEVHVTGLSTTTAAPIEADPNFVTQRTIPLFTAVIAMNTTVAPFDNKLVRQAFAYAANREDIINISYDGFGTEARFMCYTNCFGVDYGDATDYAYNPEKAKALLAEAGYPNGMNLADFGVEMKVIDGYMTKMAQVFQQNLADIGVTIDLVTTSTADEDVESGNFAIMTQGISYRADFSYSECHYGTVGIGGNNYGQMSDPWVDEMFHKGLVETDPEGRKEIYRELIEYLIDYCPCVYTFHKEEIWAWTKDLNARVKDSYQYPYHIYEWSWNN